MKKTLVLLLVVACLFGLGSALSEFTREPAVADGPAYPPHIVPPFPPDQNNIVIVADGPAYPPPIVPPFPPENSNSITG